MHTDENDAARPSTKDAEDRSGGESSAPFPGPAAADAAPEYDTAHDMAHDP